MQDENEAIEMVAHVLARRTGTNRAELTLTNGIVLELKSVPMQLTSAVTRELERKRPQPPSVWIEDKERHEENPMDPAYMKAVEDFEEFEKLALEDLALGAGTMIKSIPEGISGPDEEEWLEDPRIQAAVDAGLNLDVTSRTKRKVAWLRFYALETYVDLLLHSRLHVEVQGISETEVEDALDSFRGVPQRSADPGSPAPIRTSEPNRDNRATRRASSRSGAA